MGRQAPQAGGSAGRARPARKPSIAASARIGRATRSPPCSRRGRRAPTLVNDPEPWKHFSDLRNAMMYLELVGYLPGDILVKADRATMGASVEGRMPFLDRQLVEFAWRLPMDLKFRAGQGKYLLRRLLRRYVNPEVTERPKMGFAAPVDRWLRGPLRDWAEALLDDTRNEGRRLFRARHSSPDVDGASGRAAQLAVPSLDNSNVSGVVSALAPGRPAQSHGCGRGIIQAACVATDRAPKRTLCAVQWTNALEQRFFLPLVHLSHAPL